ncbi:MAG: TAT-variant-translocated molybdopterin oxidoreductase [Opitutales bacterium]|nr:TAT-variant-translocated molybdopterin oxidoreductase [Opitutales bacterium]
MSSKTTEPNAAATPSTVPTDGRAYWRSLDELAERPDFKEWLHREFPQGASEADGVNRRHFLKIMAASFALSGAGLAGCRRPEKYIVPYGKQPENSIPGIPVYYSTSFPDAVDNLPLIVETHQNRPTHIEGNPKYAPYGGAVNAFASASVLNLYDPDRMTASTRGRRRVSKDAVNDHLEALRERFAPTGGTGLAVLAAPSTSPSRERLMRQLRDQFPRMTWAEYEPAARDNGDRAATALFNGDPTRPVYDLAAAKRILSIDSDFLGVSEPGANGLQRGFAKGRKVRNRDEAATMSRLYVAESPFTSTGAMADHRLRLASSRMASLAALVAAEVLDQLGQERDLAQNLRSQAAGLESHQQWVSECVRDLLAERGGSVVLAGAHLPVAVHQLVVLINEKIGANGHTVRYVRKPRARRDNLESLVQSIGEGRVETLIVLGGNPAYDFPADLDWSVLRGRVNEVIRHGYYFDETGLDADWSIASTHYLEAWSDGRAYDGTYVPVQPMILPLFEGISELELLSRLAGTSRADAFEIVLETFRTDVSPGASRHDFNRFLSEGFLADSAFPAVTTALSTSNLRSVLARADFRSAAPSSGSLSVRLVKDTKVGDGFYANNGWLQELPDPMTKLTWDNAITISPALARELGYDVKSGRFLIGGIAAARGNVRGSREFAPVGELTIDGVTLRGPVQIQPGLPDYEVVIPIGYGRRRTGRVGSGVGFSAYPALTHTHGLSRTGATITLTRDTFLLANTQMHWNMEGRAIIREANVSTHLANSNWANEMGMESHSPPIYGKDKDMSLAEKSLTQPRGASSHHLPAFGEPAPNLRVWRDPEARAQFIPEQQWGMSIDLNTCTGCNVCVIACQSENNIPIVGKDQVARGREMSWIRLDRYYSTGDIDENREMLPADPQASVMPMACVHCERAPCEQVCPVNATVHDTQGLNVMAYNRCVGTRYCANNCPYKVRRFNFFDYNKRAIDEFYKGPLGRNLYKTEGGILASMQRNPDVTVRMRGVMEKCTYCTQRIQAARIAQKVKARDSNNIHIPEGAFKVACQAACPTESIVFGDISNTESAVYKAKDNDRDYAVLGYLNVRPRTTYLARLRNPNPAMPDYRKYPGSYEEYKGMQPQPRAVPEPA